MHFKCATCCDMCQKIQPLQQGLGAVPHCFSNKTPLNQNGYKAAKGWVSAVMQTTQRKEEQRTVVSMPRMMRGTHHSPGGTHKCSQHPLQGTTTRKEPQSAQNAGGKVHAQVQTKPPWCPLLPPAPFALVDFAAMRTIC